jgi:hypothetical protein
VAPLAAVLLWLGANAVFAAESTLPHRFELSGSGTLKLDPPVLQNDRLRLNGVLAPADAASPALAPQYGGGFVVTGVLSPETLVCYNDTIFRDDFDGDGF